ncbi:MAG: RNA-binding protein [Curvibacter sp. RIFCSPHIGHO2_12_FULL_63_18]|uniref:RNA-binding S4 domain-containing protein n=1 Tax=Rhodoferax sp. TaxID=50421 RepID=UPI0008BB085E|nr:S4 domain-containing protein [Rhodoferax sp.]OGO94947.1 MAG: RNA-binding protein [Curvibacter sp. GWA2_63_95]OGP01390.1 MAG: RNA-binding protein [Curvibacter sp. RIFCSPHIGHO2_12_FULL_63_18]HCX82271.1 RNA-binding protein [Rhodoferax sp.]
MDSTRIDKWLWAARFFKTRSLATDEVNKGHVQMAQHDIKPSKDIRVGDVLTIWQAKVPRTVVVKGVSDQRGPASVAQQLYEETPESIAKRANMAEHKRLAAEPAHTIEHGRPTKRDRRALDKGWGDRWSASVD